MKLKSFVVVEQDDRYLLICEKSKKHKGKWYFPGGLVGKKEIPQEAVMRETEEESGLTIGMTGIIYMAYHNTLLQPELDIFYCGRPTGGTLKTGKNEHSLGAAWYTFEDLALLPLRGNALEVIRAYRDFRAELPLHHFSVG